MRIVAPVLGLILTVAGRAIARNISLTPNLGYATYRGELAGGGVSHWLGMRYAAPPLGNLRFRAPQDPLTTSSVQLATSVGPILANVQHRRS